MKILYKKEKGVSPVIATILMVAITVVLASAVYLIVSGYFSGTPSKPVAIGVVPSTTANATKFLISSGNISLSSSTPLTISVTISGKTYTGVLSSLGGTFTLNATQGQTPGVGGYTYTISGHTYLAAGDYIMLSYYPTVNSTAGPASPLPPGSTVTWTYNGNVIYSYSA